MASDALIAQLVEHNTENVGVGSSILPQSTLVFPACSLKSASSLQVPKLYLTTRASTNEAHNFPWRLAKYESKVVTVVQKQRLARAVTTPRANILR